MVEVLIRSGSGFEFSASSVFRFDSIVALAVYDWDQDGKPELAIVTQARANLLFYEVQDKALVYEREVTLRSKPDALVGTVSADGDERLYLLSAGQESLTASYLRPGSGNLRIAARPRGVRAFQLEGDGAPEILSWSHENRLVLLRRDSEGTRLMGSLEVVLETTPLSIVGPHSSEGMWELMYLP